MMTEEAMKKMVEEQLEAKLNGNKAIAAEEPQEKEAPVVKKLDPDDTVRLENFILKQHNETLTRQLEEVRRKDFDKLIAQVRDDFQEYLAEKYEVNLETHTIKVDAKAYKLVISPLEE
jgi:ribosomal protein S12 methylthiotransferase accessory factor YcaO